MTVTVFNIICCVFACIMHMFTNVVRVVEYIVLFKFYRFLTTILCIMIFVNYDSFIVCIVVMILVESTRRRYLIIIYI